MTTKTVARPGDDLHTFRAGCIPAALATGRRGNAPLYVKPETYPCDGHGRPSAGHSVSRLDYLMTYWVGEGVSGEYRDGPYPTRIDAERALSATPR